ncbi:MAG: RNA methyltransferase [Bacteroidetes bacterium]|nr:RNA methyltransferase [Bacteroidota bacterium]MBU1718584.1 RNA methyltransferase [Bacteroidota bacterium]
MEITSSKNDKIKTLQRLISKSHDRRSEGLFVCEGTREIIQAIQSGYHVEEIYKAPEILKKQDSVSIFSALPVDIITFTITSDIYNKIAYRENSGGILAVLKPSEHSLTNIPLPENPLILVIDQVEKPGNLGAMMRTAEAAGISAILICDSKTDLYNPNVIRSSLGCVFRIPIAVCSIEEAGNFLRKNCARIFLTDLEAAISYLDADFSGPTAIVAGAEATGIRSEWRKLADQSIIIPMNGEHDSLNVSASTAIVLFEAVRQRLPGK